LPNLVERTVAAAKAAGSAFRRPAVTGSTFIDSSGYGSAMPIFFPDLYTAYKNSADVYRAVDVISKSVGKKGYELTDATGKEKGDSAEIQRFEDFVLGRDDDGNPGTGSVRRMVQKTMQAWGIAGNHYWVLTKNQTGTEYLQWDSMLPQYVQVLADQYGQPLGYFQRVPGREVIEFSPAEVIHTKLSDDPEYETFGLSPLDIIIRTEVIADLAAAVSNRTIFENDQIPPIMYLFEDFIADDEIKAIKEQLKKRHEGARNRHRNLYLRGVKDVKPIAITNQEAEFMKLRSLATEKVCAAYGVPKSILGYRDTAYGGSATASVLDQRSMYELTIEPLERLFEMYVNSYLLPRLGITKTRFRFHPTSTEDIDKIHEYAREDAKNGIITANEARKKIGYETFDGNPFADELLIHTAQGGVELGNIVGATPPADGATKQLRSDIAALVDVRSFLDDLNTPL
jgi:HK97 family phage portal protein